MSEHSAHMPREELEESGHAFLEEMPEGWRFSFNADGSFNSMVHGYAWASNGRSRFERGFDHAHVRIPEEVQR